MTYFNIIIIITGYSNYVKKSMIVSKKYFMINLATLIFAANLNYKPKGQDILNYYQTFWHKISQFDRMFMFEGLQTVLDRQLHSILLWDRWLESETQQRP